LYLRDSNQSSNAGASSPEKSFVNIAGQKSDKIVVKEIAQADIKSGMMAGS